VDSISFAIALAIAAAFGWSLLDLLRRFLAAHLPALPLVALVTLGAVPPLFVWFALSGSQHVGPGYLPYVSAPSFSASAWRRRSSSGSPRSS
jgi:hypothetical protein